MQVTQRLLEPYWHQWRTDTETVVAHLPLIIQHLEQPQMVALTLERWLHELKVHLHARLNLACMTTLRVLDMSIVSLI